MSKLDLIGQRFGRLIVINFAYIKNKHSYWECLCDCGNNKIILGSNLIRELTKSCGCFKKESAIKRFQGKALSNRHRKKLSDSHKGNVGYWLGKKYTRQHKQNLSESHKGKKVSINTRQKMSNAQKIIIQKGNHNLWKGGITPVNKKIRNSLVYRLWREIIFIRDNWTCCDCKIQGVYLHAHHLKSFARYPELRFEINNGITLCNNCHYLKHTHKFVNIVKRLNKGWLPEKAIFGLPQVNQFG